MNVKRFTPRLAPVESMYERRTGAGPVPSTGGDLYSSIPEHNPQGRVPSWFSTGGTPHMCISR